MIAPASLAPRLTSLAARTALASALLFGGAAFAASTDEALTPHLDSVAGVATNALGSTVFINHGLVGVGHISASSLDTFGESFGSMSGMQITGFATNADGSYTGTLNVLPDRGYNSGAFFADYAARAKPGRERIACISHERDSAPTCRQHLAGERAAKRQRDAGGTLLPSREYALLRTGQNRRGSDTTDGTPC